MIKVLVKNLRSKLFIVPLIASLLLLSALPVKGQSGDFLYSYVLVKPVTIDGAVGTGEWADAYKQYLGGNASTFIFIKHDSDFLYILLDVTNDTTQDNVDIGYLSFDIGERLIWDLEEQGFSIYYYAPWGNYTKMHTIENHKICCHPEFNQTKHPGLAGEGGFGTSPDGPTNHTIFEFKIPFYMLPPLTGAAGESVGLYILVYDYITLKYTDWPPGATYPWQGKGLDTIGDLVLTGNTFISHEAVWKEFKFYVYTLSNSTVSDFNFSQPDKQISFNVTGDSGTPGFCNVTIPKALLRENETQSWDVHLDGSSISYIKAENDTHTFLYFTYTHSTHYVQIIGAEVIPEFPTATIPMLLVALTIVLVFIRRRTKGVQVGH